LFKADQAKHIHELIEKLEREMSASRIATERQGKADAGEDFREELLKAVR
jgi:hypothetical protein